MAHKDLKRKLIVAGKILVAQGHDDFTRGHVSVRVPGEPSLFYMKPHSIGFDEITLKNILTIDLDGKVVAGDARRHSEVYIHSEIYRARSDVHSVIHSHPPFSTALSGSTRPLKAYSQPGALFAGETSIYTDTIYLIRSAELGKGVAKALGRNRVVLLKNHGVVVTGKTIEESVISSIMLENAAQVQLALEAAGNAAPEFPASDVAKLKKALESPEQFAINFDYLARRVARTKA